MTPKLFYDRLFALDASLKPLFRGDMQEQGRKVMTMQWGLRSRRRPGKPGRAPTACSPRP
jgi:hypothetical protein